MTRLKDKAAKAAHSNQQKANPKPAEELAYYDSFKGSYWTKDANGLWMQMTEGSMKRRLKYEIFADEESKELQFWKVDKEMLRIQLHCNVAWAGEVAGYKAGIHNICGHRVLMTSGPKLIQHAPGRWDTLRKLIEELLQDQTMYFYAWLKCGLQSLYKGAPFRPGQMLAIAGKRGDGKSFLQNLLTVIFGGRSGKPYRYLIGQTTFNSDLIASEHLMVEDDANSTDYRSRSTFGGMLKNMSVNETQSLHRKTKDAIMVTPFARLTITLNDEPKALAVLPPIEESIADKIILLRSHKATFPNDGEDLDGRNRYKEQLIKEIPAFISFLRSYEIPVDLKNQRYGVSAYQDSNLIWDLADMTPETKLLNLIDNLQPWEAGTAVWEGTSAELEIKLREKDKTGMVRDLMSFSTACGVYLQSLSLSRPKRVSSDRKDNGSRVWKIYK